MSLSCSCDADGDYAWYYQALGDYSPLRTKRGRRCCSCNEIIKVGSVSLEFERNRYAKTDIEDRIYGDGPDVPMPSHFHCETCADLYFSLAELGFECISPGEDMRELVKDYAIEYGPVKTVTVKPGYIKNIESMI